MICMRADDPAAQQETVPRMVVQDRLKVMFDRALHPLLFDQIERKLDKAGVQLNSTDFVSHQPTCSSLLRKVLGSDLFERVHHSTWISSGDQ